MEPTQDIKNVEPATTSVEEEVHHPIPIISSGVFSVNALLRPFILLFLCVLLGALLASAYFASHKEVAKIPVEATPNQESTSTDLANNGILHTYDDCNNGTSTEFVMNEKYTYALVLVCGGKGIKDDPTVVVERDEIFLKDLTTGKYYGSIPYESPVRNSYSIAAISYPRIFIVSCWEGCGSYVMIELNQGANDPFRYFDISSNLFRNAVSDFLDVVNGKVIVAGVTTISEFDPVTFNTKPIFGVKEGESLGFWNTFPIFESSIKKVDDKHIEFKIYSGSSTVMEGNETPKEDSIKTLEIK